MRLRDEIHRGEVLKALEVSIAHWTSVVEYEKDSSRKNNESFECNGRMYDPTPWAGNCILCEKFQTPDEENNGCTECPMFGRWSEYGDKSDEPNGVHCDYSSSPYKLWRSSIGNDDETSNAAIVLADMLRARAYYKQVSIKKDEPKAKLAEFRFLRLKSAEDLLKMEGIVPEFDGTEIRSMNDAEISSHFISRGMLKNRQIVRVTSDKFERMQEHPTKEQIHVFPGQSFLRWMEEVDEPADSDDWKDGY